MKQRLLRLIVKPTVRLSRKTPDPSWRQAVLVDRANMLALSGRGWETMSDDQKNLHKKSVRVLQAELKKLRADAERRYTNNCQEFIWREI